MTSHDLHVGEVARRFGLRDSALRFYERRGLLHPPRDTKGKRRYREKDLRDLAFLLMCRNGGLQLDEVSVLMGHDSADSGRWQDIVEERIVRIDAEMARLQAARHFLDQARQCTSEHPAVECPYAQPILDRMVADTAQRDA
ncbi:MAG: MerR family transcriptional regulator [Actinomycetia bacterium]|nr:MerR family transcriptional regulator [Actinomycetes bacterium]